MSSGTAQNVIGDPLKCCQAPLKMSSAEDRSDALLTEGSIQVLSLLSLSFSGESSRSHQPARSMRMTSRLNESHVTKELSFLATEDKGNVSAILLKPKGATHLLVLGHGAGADMRSAPMQKIAESLAEQKIATFRYNFPFKEAGRSGVDSPKVATATVRSAVEAARKIEPKLNLLAGGHSFGGRMTTTAQSESPLDGVKGLVLFSFPLHAPNRPDDSRAAHLSSIKIPMLFLTGTRDALNDLELFRPVVKKLGKRATLHLLDTADHGYKVLKKTRGSAEDVFVEMARLVREWANAQACM